jgi:hypothetical protein
MLVSLPTYERGDYVEVDFPDEVTGVGESGKTLLPRAITL